jgi:hypothetical protein
MNPESISAAVARQKVLAGQTHPRDAASPELQARLCFPNVFDERARLHSMAQWGACPNIGLLRG